MPEIYTWVILLINQSKEIGEKQLSAFGSRGGQISPFMYIALWHGPLDYLIKYANLLWEWKNSVDPDQTAPRRSLIWVCSIFFSVLVPSAQICRVKLVPTPTLTRFYFFEKKRQTLKTCTKSGFFLTTASNLHTLYCYYNFHHSKFCGITGLNLIARGIQASRILC